VKKYLLFLFSGVLAVTLAACGTTGTGYQYDFSQSQRQGTTIRVWADDTDGDFMDELIEAFNVHEPDIQVDFQHMGTVDARERLEVFGPSGNGADIIQFPHDHLANALEADLLYALPTDVATRLNERMSPISMSIATACYNAEATENQFDCDGVNQQVFAAPLSVESVALMYNKELLREIEGDDFEVVTSFEQIISRSKEYNDTSVQGGKYYFNTNFNDAYFMNFALTAFGFEPFGPEHSDADNPGIDTPEVIKALTWIQDELSPLYGTAGAANIQSQADRQFEDGDLPYIITGPWKIETYNNLGMDFGVTSIPTINIDGVDVDPKPFVGAQLAAIYKYSDNIEAAITFLEFWTSDEGLEIQYKHKGNLPALTPEHIENIAGVSDDEALIGIAHQIENTIPMPTIPQIQSYWEPVRIMIEKTWNNQATPAEAAEEAEEGYYSRRGLSE
jgi:arabinogalactan oligomer/maltooligosaccharide transport system substrate-binding protein